MNKLFKRWPFALVLFKTASTVYSTGLLLQENDEKVLCPEKKLPLV